MAKLFKKGVYNWLHIHNYLIVLFFKSRAQRIGLNASWLRPSAKLRVLTQKPAYCNRRPDT